MSLKSSLFLTAISVNLLFSHASKVTIDMGDNIRTDLKTFLNDLHITAASVQYTASENIKLVNELRERLAHNKVHCACDEPKVRVKSTERKRLALSPIDLIGPLLTWNEARKKCEAQDKSLAVIESREEARDIEQVFQVRNSADGFGKVEHAYVGFHSLFGDNDWLTIDGEPITTLQREIWDRADFRNSTSKKCAAITAEGSLTSVDCETPRVFLCM